MLASLSFRQAVLAASVVLGVAECEEPLPPLLDEEVPASVELLPDSVRFAVIGDTAQLAIAHVRTASGAELTEWSAQWEVTDSSRVTVDSSGVVTALAEGMSSVVVRVGAATDTTRVVVLRVPAVLRVEPDTIALSDFDEVGQASVAEFADSAGMPLSHATIVWSTSAAEIATVSVEGSITARAPGTAVIRVRGGPSQHRLSDSVVVVVDIPPPPNASCAHPAAVTHGGAVSGTWGANASPRLVRSAITIEESVQLRIDPGVIVCFEPDARMLVRGTLSARGTAQSPVTLTSTDTTQRWLGIQTGDDDAALELDHVVVEHLSGVEVVVGSLHADSSMFRRFGGLRYDAGELRRSRVEGEVRIGAATFEDNVIRGGGLTVFTAGGVELLGGRIEQAPDTGLRFAPRSGFLATVTAYRPIRIVGARATPASIPGHNLAVVFADPASADSMLGNAKDTLHVYGLMPVGHATTLTPALPWRSPFTLVPFTNSLRVAGTLTVEPGAALLGTVLVNGRLLVTGTAAEPVTLRGIYIFDGAPALPSLMEHVILEGSLVEARHSHTLLIRNLAAHRSSVHLISLNSRLTSSVVDAGAFDPYSARLLGRDVFFEQAVLLAGPGARMDSTVVSRSATSGIGVTGSGPTLSHCQISESAEHGIEVRAGSDVVVRRCNLVDNAGAGVANATAQIVDARENWWGDPAGPTGPQGDGVSGSVNATDPLGVPVVF